MIQSIGSRRSPGGPEVKHGGHSQCSRFPNCNGKSVRPGRRRRNFRHWLYSHSQGHRTDWCTSQEQEQEQVEVEAEAAKSEAVEMAEMVEQQLALAAMAVSYSMAEMVEVVEKQMVEEEQEQHGGHSRCSRFRVGTMKTLPTGRRRRSS